MFIPYKYSRENPFECALYDYAFSNRNAKNVYLLANIESVLLILLVLLQKIYTIVNFFNGVVVAKGQKINDAGNFFNT